MLGKMLKLSFLELDARGKDALILKLRILFGIRIRPQFIIRGITDI